MIHELELSTLSRKNRRSKWPWIAAAAFIVVAGLTVLTSGQQGGRLADPRDSLHVPILTFGPQGPAELEGLPNDWSHHHLVFSNPGTEQDAIQKGTYDDWLRIVNNPRYIMQELKHRSPAQGPAAEYVARMNEMARAQEAAASEELAAPEFKDPVLPVLPKPGRPPKAKIHRDWSMDLGSYSTAMAGGQYPAEFSLSNNSASCSDFVVYTTGLAGSSSQATVVAYSNIYATTCSGRVPSIYWAYNTGGTATLSPIINGNGNEIAYIQTTGSAASLVLLKLASSGGTVGAPASITSVTNSNFYKCTAPCYTTITLNGSPNDTNSSPFYDYPDDIIYVGDNSGKLHKFTPVFTGTPAEVTSGWPILVSSNILTSPVYDSGTSGNVFVADSGGFLYSYTTAGAAVMKSSQLAATGSKGIVDSPLVDSTTEMVYVFVGDDENTNTTGAGPRDCDNATGCNGVFQFAAGNTTSGTGVCTSSSATSWGTATNCGNESVFGVGNTSTVLYDGSFDQVYYSGTGTTGNLWACGATGTPAPKLMYTTMSAFVPSGDVIGIATNAINPLTGAGVGVGTAATCSPVTEIYGTDATTDDYIFLSVTNDGNQTGTACSGTGAAGACLYNFLVSTNGTSTATVTAATAGLAVAGGSSGIVIDNTSTSSGASQIYFSSLSNEACTGNGTTGNGTGGCAVQASQAAP
jgi:hypothetical protein